MKRFSKKVIVLAMAFLIVGELLYLFGLMPVSYTHLDVYKRQPVI